MNFLLSKALNFHRFTAKKKSVFGLTEKIEDRKDKKSFKSLGHTKNTTGKWIDSGYVKLGFMK